MECVEIAPSDKRITLFWDLLLKGKRSFIVTCTITRIFILNEQHEQIPTAEVEVLSAETNVYGDGRAEPLPSDGAASEEPSEVIPIMSFRRATSDIPENGTDGVKLVSYKVREDEEPPRYEDIISQKVQYLHFRL